MSRLPRSDRPRRAEPPPRLGDSRALLLRGLSNHAIAVRLARPRARPAAAARTLARALVDFGVQVHVGRRPRPGQPDEPVVGALDVGGRPQGLFGSQHRSHTTAWVVFTDVVRATILTQPLPEAIRRMHGLIADARQLPGAHPGRLRALEQAVQIRPEDAPDVTGRQIYDNALTHAQRVMEISRLALESDIGAGLLVPVLQDLIEAYLRLRNATPLSVTHDVDIARGRGEGSARGGLMSDEAEEAPADVREATAGQVAAAEAAGGGLDVPGARQRLWALLDTHATLHIATTNPPLQPAYSTVPGSSPGESAGGRLAAVVIQHLLTVRRAYPRVFAYANMAAEDSLRPVLGTLADAQTATGQTVIQVIQAELGVAPALPAPGDRTNVVVPQVAPRGAAQIVFGNANGVPTVGLLRLGSRPFGILGAPDGAHLTAFGLIAQALKQSVEGQPLQQVPAILGRLITAARALPTYARAGALAPDNRIYHQAADARATEMLNAAQATDPRDPAFVAVLQELILAYLWLRNSLPLSATTEGGPAGGKGEAQSLAELRWAERQYQQNGRVDDAEVLDALWGLLDAGAVNNIARSVALLASPGIRPMTPEEPLLRIGDIVRTHLDTAAAAFPLSVARAQMRGQASVVAFLQGGLPRPNAQRLQRQDEIARRREDESLTLADDEARRAAAYILTGILPPPAVQPVAQRRSTRARSVYNPYPGEHGEDAFAEMEVDMTHASARVGWNDQ